MCTTRKLRAIIVDLARHNIVDVKASLCVYMDSTVCTICIQASLSVYRRKEKKFNSCLYELVCIQGQ